MKGIKTLILILVIAVAGVILINEVNAQAEKGLAISPLTFELTANPGDVLTNKLKVYNPTDSIVGVTMEVEDFTVAGERGEVMIGPAEIETYSIAQWITTEPEAFTLGPKEQKLIDFTISVPEKAEPGGKYGSVLATTTGVIREGITGPGVAQKVGALVLLTIAGEVKEGLRIKEFIAPSFLETGPVPFTIRFENTGTVHVRPRGFVSIVNWWGKKVADVEFPQLNVIPGAIRKIETKWDNKWLFGKYTAMLVGSYGTANLPFNPPVLTFWAFPWKIFSGIILALAIIIFYFYKTRKRWRLALRILMKGE